MKLLPYSILFSLFFFTQQFCPAQNRLIDSLEHAFSIAKSDTTKCNLLSTLSDNIYDSKPDTIISLSELIIKMADANLPKANAAEKRSFLISKASALNNIGIIKGDQGKIQEAIDYYLKSLNAHIENNYKPGIANAEGNLGIIYDNLGDVPKALEYFHKSLKIQEALNIKDGIALTLNNIGFIYMNQKDPVKALEYYNRSLKYRLEINDKNMLPQSLNNIANIYQNFGDPNCKKEKEICAKEGQLLALDYYKRCLKIQEENQDTKGMAYSYNNMASIYRQFGDPNCPGTAEERKKQGNAIAMEYLLKSLKYHEEIKNTLGVAYVSNNIAQVYINEGDYKQALEYSTKSMAIAREIAYPEIIYRNAMTLKKIYQAQKDFQKAFEMYQLETQMRDSIDNMSNEKALITQNTKYEYEKKSAADSVRVSEEKKVVTAQLKQEKTQRYSLYIGLLLVLAFSGVMFNRFRITQKQKLIIEKQKEVVDQKRKEIVESITYAKRLQDAILPPQEFINKHLSDNFIFYRPKDIVAGDFYWAEKVGDLFFMAAADSTGHGVPGAMVSVVCSNALNRTIKEFKITEPGKILDKTRDLVLETFEKSMDEVKDGMDISLVCINKTSRQIFWSGANNPLWYVQNDEFREIKADKQPIGKTDNPLPFTTHKIEYVENSIFYLFTDGYADQFGGEKGKKFKYKQMSELLFRNSHLPKSEQKENIQTAFESWKGHLEQVDDVCVIGLKI